MQIMGCFRQYVWRRTKQIILVLCTLGFICVDFQNTKYRGDGNKNDFLIGIVIKRSDGCRASRGDRTPILVCHLAEQCCEFQDFALFLEINLFLSFFVLFIDMVWFSALLYASIEHASTLTKPCQHVFVVKSLCGRTAKQSYVVVVCMVDWR